ncbi:NAD-dependent epimerase/dehydratase family protein [Methanoregula formicica]|uniref:Nucleoside-diphosphate-sugar epimerase n=1 Tax=Methanoregula formicica (strain DSM 22288 / NBRC 105244 / SMSP) TaxID=593750 RepID=L0HCH6_METFS|nr:SDR family NAD(P)-dependent oxidoreductase [Methanoregula formicica]AGB01511.1 nucleoside-diphosphate-sugar epimerase [Methanoregula formicica SMSP]
MPKFYLVTGGTGFIGSALVHRLIKKGLNVRVFDNNSRGSFNRLNDITDKIDFFEGDIRDKRTVNRAMEDIDSVIHLAFVNGTEFFYTKPEFVLDVGVKGITNILDACQEKNVRELVLASSSEVYQTPPIYPTNESVPLSIPDPLNPRYSYAAGKIISEIMAINFGRKFFDRVIIFRPHNVYGPDMGWEHVIPQFAVRIKQLLNNSSEKTIRFPVQGNGSDTRSFIFIEDFISGLELILDKGKHLEIYHIGTQEEISIANLANMVADYYNQNICIVPGQAALGGTQRRCPDISKMRSLGFHPKYSLKEGLSQTLKWYDSASVIADSKT